MNNGTRARRVTETALAQQMATPVCAAIFDFDGVVVDTNPLHRDAIRRLCQRYGVLVSDETLKQRVYGRRNREWIPDIFSTTNRNEIENLSREKEALFWALLKGRMAPVRGIRSFLNDLRTHGVPVAIASSGTARNVATMLRQIGLDQYFEVVVSAETVTVGKPDPEIYSFTADALRTNPARCVVFEDSLVGIQSAVRAGCKVVGVTTTHTRHELRGAQMTVHDFRGLSFCSVQDLVQLA